MKYVIAGKTDTFIKYRQKNASVRGKDVINVRTLKKFNEITEYDTILLLQGWWGRSWAKEALKNIMIDYPQISVEYMDGAFGESERKTLKSDTIHDRFEILDL